MNTHILKYLDKFTRFMPPTIFILETMVASISPLSSRSVAPPTTIFVPLEKQDAFTHSIPNAYHILSEENVRKGTSEVNQRK